MALKKGPAYLKIIEIQHNHLSFKQMDSIAYRWAAAGNNVSIYFIDINLVLLSYA